MTGSVIYNGTNFAVKGGSRVGDRMKGKANAYSLYLKNNNLTERDRVKAIKALPKRSALRACGRAESISEIAERKLSLFFTASFKESVALAARPIAAIISVFLIVIFFVNGSVVNNEREQELDMLQSAKMQETAYLNTLENKLEEKNDLEMIKNIAVNEYGMVSGDKRESNIVSLSNQDAVVIHGEAESEGYGTLLSALSEILSKFGNIFGE